MDRDLKILKKYNYLTYKIAKNNGISKYKFYQYVKNIDLEK